MRIFERNLSVRAAANLGAVELGLRRDSALKYLVYRLRHDAGLRATSGSVCGA